MTQDLVVDKTAEVYDYKNRIYQVDLMASSGYHMISPALALEFVVDASRFTACARSSIIWMPAKGTRCFM